VNRIILVIFFCFIYNNIFSQNNILVGQVYDSSSKKVISLATVSIFKVKDASFLTYRLTNEKGGFKINDLPIETPVKVVVSAVGYYTFRIELSLTKEIPIFSLGNIFLKQKENELDEVLVISERPPVIVKKDTIEFNAASFKTLPAALVEDLLKKLPGIQVNDEGNITFNGKSVSRILVEGKRFFGDNYKMATRNLPANIIEKIQVVDDKDDLEFTNEVINVQSNKVINLTFKKGIKKGWFGRLYGGIGTQQRYETGGIINLFKDTLQLSLIGYDNNVNRSSFSIQDLNTAGGFNRSGMSSMFINRGVSGEQFNINGISFGGGTTGISRSTGAGFNLNHSPSKNLSFYAQYFFGYGKNNLESITNTTTPFGQGNFISNTNNTSIDKNYSHIMNFSLNWKIDSLSRLTSNIGFIVKRATLTKNILQQTETDNEGILSKNIGIISSFDSSISFNYSLSYLHRFKRTKKSIGITHSFSIVTNPFTQLTETLNTIYYPQFNSILFPQRRDNNNPSNSKNFNIRFSNVINKKFNYDLFSSLNYSISGMELITYTKANSSIIYDSVVLNASNTMERSSLRYNNGFSITFSRNSIRLSSNINWQQHWISDYYAITTQKQQRMYYSFVLPSFNLNVKRVTFSYTENIALPSIDNLAPVPDNSNPLYVIRGNPNLKPIRQRYFNIYTNFGNDKKGISRTLNFYNSFNSNEIVRRIVIDSSGIQTSTPENINNTTSIGYSFDSYGKILPRHGLSINYSYSVNGSAYSTTVLINRSDIGLTSFNQNFSIGINFNWNDVFQFNPRYSGGIYLNKYFGDNSTLHNNTFFTQNLQGVFIVRPTKKLIVTNSYKVINQSQSILGIPATGLLVNADITYLVFNNNRGQIKLFINDIFNTNRGIYGSLSANSLSITRSNILNQYFLLSITYDIRDWLKQTSTNTSLNKGLLRF
jgi:hypothetical protein